MMDKSTIEYRLGELKKMISAELRMTEQERYGAHLSHWSGVAKPIQLDLGALLELYHYYKSLLEK
jgi:hypothetical protein